MKTVNMILFSVSELPVEIQKKIKGDIWDCGGIAEDIMSSHSQEIRDSLKASLDLFDTTFSVNYCCDGWEVDDLSDDLYYIDNIKSLMSYVLRKLAVVDTHDKQARSRFEWSGEWLTGYCYDYMILDVLSDIVNGKYKDVSGGMFASLICERASQMYQDELEYVYSLEYMVEYMEANGYYFTANGKRIE